MLKVTIKFIVYCAFILFFGCSDRAEHKTEKENLHFTDSVSEARIDSAYTAIKKACDTMMVYRLPKMVDSFIKEPALLQSFFDTNIVYRDADKKVEKVIRQLQAECDSNLLKETYRIALLRQKVKLKRHIKAKV